jgi:hypothetical protein
LSLQDQVNERFSKAIAQLGSEQLDVRIGSIYALEQIARDSPKTDDAPGLHWPIVEIVTAFVREHTRAVPGRSPLDEKKPEHKQSPSGPDRAGSCPTSRWRPTSRLH